MTWLIDARALTKRYGDTLAVDGIDLQVPAGRCVGIVGRNGAGKSTTMRMLTTVTRPTSGTLTLLGLDAASEPARIKARLGVVPQANHLDDDLSAFANLEIYARYFRMSRARAREAAEHALTLAGLQAKASAPVRTLSGGMRRRLVIARALVNEPDLLLLDEPTAALDAQSKQHIWSTIGERRAQGRSILLMSHDMEEVETLCDEVLLMEHGRFVDRGAPHELIARHCRPALLDIVVDSVSGVDWAAVLGQEHAEPRPTPRGVVVEVDDPEASMHRLRTSAVEFTAATVRPSSLTEVFLKVTGHEPD